MECHNELLLQEEMISGNPSIYWTHTRRYQNRLCKLCHIRSSEKPGLTKCRCQWLPPTCEQVIDLAVSSMHTCGTIR